MEQSERCETLSFTTFHFFGHEPRMNGRDENPKRSLPDQSVVCLYTNKQLTGRAGTLFLPKRMWISGGKTPEWGGEHQVLLKYGVRSLHRASNRRARVGEVAVPSARFFKFEGKRSLPDQSVQSVVCIQTTD